MFFFNFTLFLVKSISGLKHLDDNIDFHWYKYIVTQYLEHNFVFVW